MPKSKSIFIPLKNTSKVPKLRYLWEDAPERVDIYNRFGMPLSPFEVELEDR